MFGFHTLKVKKEVRTIPPSGRDIFFGHDIFILQVFRAVFAPGISLAIRKRLPCRDNVFRGGRIDGEAA